MRSKTLFLNTFVLGTSLVALSGCNWIKDWPPSDYRYDHEYNYQSSSSMPDRPQYQVMQTAEGTWIKEPEQQKPQPVVSREEYEQKERAERASDSIHRRMTKLEHKVDRMRYDFEQIMPALREMIGAQEALKKAMRQVEPHAGGASMNRATPQPYDKTTAVREALNNMTPASGQPAHLAQAPVQTAPRAHYEQAVVPSRSATDIAQSYAATYKPQTHQAVPVEAPVEAARVEMERIPPRYQPVYGSGGQAPQVAQRVEVNTYQQEMRPVETAASQKYSNYQPVSYATASIKGLRIGDHGYKTRLVLDAVGAVEYKYDLDNQEGLLFINMRNTDWQEATEKVFPKSRLISGYRVIPMGQGMMQLAVQLKDRVNIEWAHSLPPAEGKPRRIIFDLVRQ